MANFFSKPKYYVPSVGQTWLITLVIIFGGGLLGGAILFMIGAFVPAMKGTNTATYCLSLTYMVQMIIPILFIWWMGHISSKDPMVQPVKINQPHIGKFSIITLGITLLFLTIALGYFLDPITDLFKMPDYFKQLFENMGDKFWDTVISTAILAPLCEEFIVRGTMERGLLSRKSPIVAILLTSFIFGLIHLNPWQFFAAFFIGLLLGWVYYRTHSIWAVIFIHFVNNFYSVISMKLYPNYDLNLSSRENIAAMTGSTLYYWLLVALGGVVTLLCIWLLNKYLPKHPDSFKVPNLLIADATAGNAGQPSANASALSAMEQNAEQQSSATVGGVREVASEELDNQNLA